MPSWPIVLPAFVMLAGIAQFYEKFFPHGKVDDWIRLGAKGALNWIETKFGRPRLLVALGTLIIALIASSAITFLGFVLYRNSVTFTSSSEMTQLPTTTA
jgi:hypothetical protein